MSRSVVVNTSSKEVTYRGEVIKYTEVIDGSIHFVKIYGVNVGSVLAGKEGITIDRITGSIIINLFSENFVNGFSNSPSDFDKVYLSQNRLAQYTGTCKKANAMF